MDVVTRLVFRIFHNLMDNRDGSKVRTVWLERDILELQMGNYDRRGKSRSIVVGREVGACSQNC